MNIDAGIRCNPTTTQTGDIGALQNSYYIYEAEDKFSDVERNRLIYYGMQHIIGRSLDFSSVKIVEQILDANNIARLVFNQRAYEIILVEEGYIFCNDVKLVKGSILSVAPGEIYKLAHPEDAKIKSAFYPSPLALTHINWSPKFLEPNVKPDVSIIIIAKDLEDYICHSLLSCMQQTHDNIEIIVVDDNSTDRTLHKVLSKAKYDSRIRVLPRDCGRNQARRIGIEKSRGRFVLVIDGDDWLNKDAIELLLLSHRNTNAECLIFGFDHYDDVTSEVFNPVYPHAAGVMDAPIYYDKDRKNSKWTSSHNHTIWMVMFSEELKDIAVESLPDCEFYEDLPFLICLLATNRRTAVCNHVLYHYRRNRNGQSTANWSNVSAIKKRADLQSVIRFILSKIDKSDLFSQSILFRKVESIVRYEALQNYLKSDSATCCDWILFWMTSQRIFNARLIDYLDQGAQTKKFLWCNKSSNSLLLQSKLTSSIIRNYIRIRIRYGHSNIFSVFRGVEKWL